MNPLKAGKRGVQIVVTIVVAFHNRQEDLEKGQVEYPRNENYHYAKEAHYLLQVELPVLQDVIHKH